MKTLLSIFLALFLAGNVYGSSISLSGGAAPTVEVLDIEATNFSTSTAAPETVYSFSIPANTLNADNRLRVTLTGDMSGGTNTVDTRMNYGATTVVLSSHTPGNDPDVWVIQAVLNGNDGTSAQDGHIIINASGDISEAATGTSAEDSTTTLTFAITVDTNSGTQVYIMRSAVLELLSN